MSNSRKFFYFYANVYLTLCKYQVANEGCVDVSGRGGCLFTQSHVDHVIGGRKVIDEGVIMC